jgi:hypothetical protein
MSARATRASGLTSARSGQPAHAGQPAPPKRPPSRLAESRNATGLELELERNLKQQDVEDDDATEEGMEEEEEEEEEDEQNNVIHIRRERK